MTITSVSTTAAAPTADNPNQKSAAANIPLKDRLTDAVVNAMQAIAKDTQDRLQGYENNLKLLDKGIFYPTEYYTALLKKKQTKRIEWLKGKDLFHDGWAPKEYFKRVANQTQSASETAAISQTGFIASAFIHSAGNASDALKAIKEGPAMLGCGQVCFISYYEALLEVLGKEKFDALFVAGTPTALSLLELDAKPKNPLVVLIESISIPKKVSADKRYLRLKKGQMCYVSNVNTYFIKHPNGEAVGFNLICKSEGSDPKFIGHGLNPQGLTNDELTAFFFKEYNKDPVGSQEIHAKELVSKIAKNHKECKMNVNGIVGSFAQAHEVFKTFKVSTIDKFVKQGAGTFNDNVNQWNVGRITQLVEASIPNACKLLQSWLSMS